MKLDKRQRAMLKEMGVTVWQPSPPEPVAPRANAIDKIATYPVSTIAAATFAPKISATPVASTPSTTPALQARPTGIERMDWPTLQTAVASCQACTLCHNRRNTVFGAGPDAPAEQAPPVDWLIVGEAPGEQEDREGQPFVGPAGQLLDQMLRALHLRRASNTTESLQALSTNVYITNVLKCRPPANRAPQPEEVAQCAPYLQRQIALLQPKIILALGRFAAQALLAANVPEIEKIPLGKLRGQLYQYQNTPVVVSYHPAYLLRSLADKAKAWDDWCFALNVLSTTTTS